MQYLELQVHCFQFQSLDKLQQINIILKLIEEITTFTKRKKIKVIRLVQEIKTIEIGHRK